jgi:hypothetical protein
LLKIGDIPLEEPFERVFVAGPDRCQKVERGVGVSKFGVVGQNSDSLRVGTARWDHNSSSRAVIMSLSASNGRTHVS